MLIRQEGGSLLNCPVFRTPFRHVVSEAVRDVNVRPIPVRVHLQGKKTVNSVTNGNRNKVVRT